MVALLAGVLHQRVEAVVGAVVEHRLVLADLEVGHDLLVVALAGEVEAVLARPAGQPVLVGPAREPVAALAAVEPVLALAAVERVVAAAADQPVVALTALEHVAAAAALEHVVLVPAGEDVLAALADELDLLAPDLVAQGRGGGAVVVLVEAHQVDQDGAGQLLVVDGLAEADLEVGLRQRQRAGARVLRGAVAEGDLVHRAAQPVGGDVVAQVALDQEGLVAAHGILADAGFGAGVVALRIVGEGPEAHQRELRVEGVEVLLEVLLGAGPGDDLDGHGTSGARAAAGGVLGRPRGWRVGRSGGIGGLGRPGRGPAPGRGGRGRDRRLATPETSGNRRLKSRIPDPG